MNTWKEKATEKLSRLFSDSPSTSPPHPLSPARPNPGNSKSWSSILSRALPLSSFDGSKSKNDTDKIKPIQSSPIKWKNRSALWQDLPSDSYEECDDHAPENKEAPNFQREDQEHGFGSRNGLENGDLSTGSSSSDSFEDAVDQHNVKSMSCLTEESSLISSDLYEFLLSCLPNIVKGCQWMLLYSTVKHGISLRTLIRRSADIPGPSFLVVGDKQGAVFGGLVECPLQPTPKRKYQGSNKTFVFTTRYGEPRLFRPTGANRYYCMCMNDLLGLGGGGNMALSLDGDLLTGTSGPCETFGNSCLAHSQEFELKNVEVSPLHHGPITRARAKIIQPTLETLLGFEMTCPSGPEAEVTSSGNLEARAFTEHEFACFVALVCMGKYDEHFGEYLG